jgi:hypothetical protein
MLLSQVSTLTPTIIYHFGLWGVELGAPMAAFNYWRVFLCLFWLVCKVSCSITHEMQRNTNLQKLGENCRCHAQRDLAIYKALTHGKTANTRQKICCPLI